MTNTLIDITGQRFGMWTAMALAEAAGPKKKGAFWSMRCDCGATAVVAGYALRSGNSTGCGCASRCRTARLSHGGTVNGRNTPTYESWVAMRRRCLNPASPSWAHYGGRGITICERWAGRGCFVNFATDMGERPPGLSLDRIDVNGNYEPSNCRWATDAEQAQNQRTTKMTPAMVERVIAGDLAALGHRDAAAILGVSEGAIGSVRLGRTWVDVVDEIRRRAA